MNPPPAEGLASRLFLGPALRTQPDRRLVTLVSDGYEAAFEEIVRRYGKPLGRYAAAIVGGRSEEVTQDAFSKALLALRGMEGDREIELRPWLYRIVRNTALNDLRDRPPDAAELAEALEGGRSVAEEAERREEVSELVERLRALPEPQRAAIVMRELEGLGHEEIAAAMGLSGGAARQAIYRARQALRNGVGALVPLPLLRALIDHGVEAGTVTGAGGAVAAGGAMGGAGTALKVGVITAVLAGGVGTGLAMKGQAHQHQPTPETAAAAIRDWDRTADPSSSPSSTESDRAEAGLAEDVGTQSEGRNGRGSDAGGSGTDSGKSGEDFGGGGHGQPDPHQGNNEGGRHGGGPGPSPAQQDGGHNQGGGPGPSGDELGTAGGGSGAVQGDGQVSGDDQEHSGSGGRGGSDGGQGSGESLPPPPLVEGTSESSPGTAESGSDGSGSGSGGGPGPN